MTETFDVVVIGGGTAGLSGALTLARARRSVLVIDAGQPRNSPAECVHLCLGKEGIPPTDLLATGRAEVESYGGQVEPGEVISAEATAGGFLVRFAERAPVTARRLLVTTGLVEELPDVPGLAERWGRDVLHCPYCHGWEVRDQTIGVLATGPLSVHQALLWRQWSPHVTFLLHGYQPEADDAEALGARGVAVLNGPVVGLVTTDDRLSGVCLANGEVVDCQTLVVAPRVTASLPVGDSVPGVWVTGTMTTLTAQVLGAAGAGMQAGAAINADLIAEETRLAVRAHRGRIADADFWDTFYTEKDRIWSGNPNEILVQEVADLTPGTALDLGSGEGADAIWLAGHGWQVTAVDISPVALDRAARAATQAGVAERIDWQRHDLYASFPAGRFDLVTASYLHSYDAPPREAVLASAAAAVAPGGVLLIVGHSTHGPSGHDVDLPTPEEVLAGLALADGEWEVLGCREYERQQTGPDGQPGTRTDNAVTVRRR